MKDASEKRVLLLENVRRELVSLEDEAAHWRDLADKQIQRAEYLQDEVGALQRMKRAVVEALNRPGPLSAQELANLLNAPVRGFVPATAESEEA